METKANYKKFDTPIKMGMLLAIIKIIISTIQYQFLLDNWLLNMVMVVVSLAIGVAVLIYIGKEQRKAMGGYIDLKNAFQGIFVAILIMVTATYVYDIVYAVYIDPDMMVKIKEASIAQAEKWGAPEESIDKIAEKFDEQSKDKYSIGNILLGYAQILIMHSIVGFICAAIVKKKKPLDFA